MRTAKVSENLQETSSQQQENSPRAKQTTSGKSPPKSRRIPKDSLENLDDDPWASPALHKGHTHTVNNEATPSSNPTAAKPLRNGLAVPNRTTSAFTTHSEEPDTTSSTMAGEEYSGREPASGGGGWGSDGPSGGGFPNAGQSSLGGGGFGSSGDDQGNHTGGTIGRSLGGGRTTNRGVEETVTVALLPEKEGMFLFQHHNYEVKSARRASSVVRRYSDFVWLLDCLHRRYPFRQLPLLPPKRVAGKAQNPGNNQVFNPNYVPSQRKTSVSGHYIHRKAQTWSCEVCQCTSQTSSPQPRATCGHVPYCAHCEF